MKVYISSDRTYALHPLRSILKIISFFVHKIFECGGGGGGGAGGHVYLFMITLL